MSSILIRIAGDTKAGTLVGTDRFGNKYYENRNAEEEVPGTSDFFTYHPDIHIVSRSSQMGRLRCSKTSLTWLGTAYNEFRAARL